jgi:hypothetical protein
MLVLVSYCQCSVVAQDTQPGTSTVYATIKARKYKIIYFGNKKSTARSLDSLKGNILYVSGNKGLQEIPLATIKEIQVAKKGRPVGRGALLGALTGIPTGALIGLATYSPQPDEWDFGPGFSAMGGAVVGALGGIITGSIAGAASYRYVHYDFSTVHPAEKHRLMSRILSGQP